MYAGQRTSRASQALESYALDNGGGSFDDFGLPVTNKQGRKGVPPNTKKSMFSRFKLGSNKNRASYVEADDSDEDGTGFDVIPGMRNGRQQASTDSYYQDPNTFQGQSIGRGLPQIPYVNQGQSKSVDHLSGPLGSQGSHLNGNWYQNGRQFPPNNNPGFQVLPASSQFAGMPQSTSMSGHSNYTGSSNNNLDGKQDYGEISMEQLSTLPDRHRYPAISDDGRAARTMSLNSMSNYDTTPVIPVVGKVNGSSNKPKKFDQYRQRMIESRKALLSSETGILPTGHQKGDSRTMSLASMNSASHWNKNNMGIGKRSNTMVNPVYNNPSNLSGSVTNGQLMNGSMMDGPMMDGPRFNGPMMNGPKHNNNMQQFQHPQQLQNAQNQHFQNLAHMGNSWSRQGMHYSPSPPSSQHIITHKNQGQQYITSQNHGMKENLPNQAVLGPPTITPQLDTRNAQDSRPSSMWSDSMNLNHQSKGSLEQAHSGSRHQVVHQNKMSDVGTNAAEFDFGSDAQETPMEDNKKTSNSEFNHENNFENDGSLLKEITENGTIDSIEKLHTEIEYLKEELLSCHEDIRVLSIELAESVRREQNLTPKNMISDNSAGLAKAQSELSLERTKRAAAESAAADRGVDISKQQRIAELEFRHDEAVRLLSIRTNQYDALKQQYASLEADFSQQIKDKEELTTKLKELETSHQQYEHNTQLAAQLQTLELENSKLRDQLNQTSDRGLLGNRISTLQDQRTALLESLRAMRECKDAEIQDLQKRIEILTISQQRHRTVSTHALGSSSSLQSRSDYSPNSEFKPLPIRLSDNSSGDDSALVLPRIRDRSLSRPASPLRIGLEYSR